MRQHWVENSGNCSNIAEVFSWKTCFFLLMTRRRSRIASSFLTKSVSGSTVVFYESGVSEQNKGIKKVQHDYLRLFWSAATEIINLNARACSKLHNNMTHMLAPVVREAHHNNFTCLANRPVQKYLRWAYSSPAHLSFLTFRCKIIGFRKSAPTSLLKISFVFKYMCSNNKIW
jgi:hypothetical protein